MQSRTCTFNFKEVFSFQGVRTKENDPREGHGVFLLWYLFYLLLSFAHCTSWHGRVTTAELKNSTVVCWQCFLKARIVFERMDTKATLILAHVTRSVMCNTCVYVLAFKWVKKETPKSPFVCLCICCCIIYHALWSNSATRSKNHKRPSPLLQPTMSNLFHF